MVGFLLLLLIKLRLLQLFFLIEFRLLKLLLLLEKRFVLLGFKVGLAGKENNEVIENSAAD